MKTEKEIRDMLDLVNAYAHDKEVNAVSQTLQWVVDENVMNPADYLALAGKR